MFNDILFILPVHALEVHGDFIKRTIHNLLPDARLRFVSEQEQTGETARVDMIVAPQVEWLSEVVLSCPCLRWLHLLTAGAEKIFEKSLHKGDYWISKSSGVNARAIAEYVLCAMLYFSKRFHVFIRQQKKHLWQREWLPELQNKKVAILGLGHVGKAVAKMCVEMDMEVVGVSRKGAAVSWMKEVYSPQNLIRAMDGAQFVVIALPLTPSTHKMMDHKTLMGMEKGSFLINVSRGGIVDEASLVEALTSGKLGGAALDVFEREPLPNGSLLWDLPNVIITPHVAGTSDRFMDRAMHIFEDNLQSLRNNGVPATPVDRMAGY